MSFETPPPYGDDRENLPPVPPELDAPPPQGLPGGTSPEVAPKGSFLTAFIVSAVLNSIPVLGLLTGFVCIVTGLVGLGTAKNAASRAKFGGVAAGGGVGLMVSAGLCIAALTNSGY